MIEYSKEDIENAKRLKYRFEIYNLIDFCRSTKIGYVKETDYWRASEWRKLEKEIQELLSLYDNNEKLNFDKIDKILLSEEISSSVEKKEFSNRLLMISRRIKLNKLNKI